MRAFSTPRAVLPPFGLEKEVGEAFIGQWTIQNNTNQNAFAALTIFELTISGAILKPIGSTGVIALPANSQLLLDVSGPTSTNWTPNVTVQASMEMVAGFDFVNALELPVLVAEQRFFITVFDPFVSI